MSNNNSSDFNKYLLDIKKDNDDKYSELIYEQLLEIFGLFETEYEPKELINYHYLYKTNIIKKIKTDIGSMKIVGVFYHNAYMVYKKNSHYDNFPVIFHICSLMPLLLEIYPLNLDPENNIEDKFSLILNKSIKLLISSVENQILSLNNALTRIIDFLKTLRLANSAVILLELPIGNSIPLQIFRLLLDKENIKHDTINIFLSRNDKACMGLKRIDLIEAKLKDYTFKNNDLIIYIDEWYTGSNFNNICEFVRKKLPENVYLYPIALLTETAKEKTNYDNYKNNHDNLLKKMGTNWNNGRFIIPRIKSFFEFNPDDIFFWSEYDRLAGYRKMQLLGSMISSFDWAIETLKNSDLYLNLTKKFLILELAEKKAILPEAWNDINVVKRYFNASYEDYQEIKSEIFEIEDKSNYGDVEEFEKSAISISDKISKLVEGRLAKFCFLLAHTFLQNYGSPNAIDRYYFKIHVPLTKKLEGVSCIFNEMFIKHYKEKFIT